ncbi:type II toxin-antitoxin system RatA family toxin [Fodinicurvata fenggangensis]|uniref:type II toxin-antitoxin system RatA family toxin n=1 Tax=Fodinicurvata fenggangensis TaxID=1121830 RepID=UPI00047C5182|nr:type II toxin-antitoxin system RatA family toxin [Fodinicurvata fenggangensis]
MPVHAEKRKVPYTSRQLFDLVADVKSYPEFLPWCLAARIKSHEDNVIYADLVIGFKMLRERFTSRVELHEEDPENLTIDVNYVEGPFKYLNNHWKFIPDEEGCLIDFYVDFEFRSRLLQRVMQPLFNEAVRRMVAAFESRAKELYG